VSVGILVWAIRGKGWLATLPLIKQGLVKVRAIDEAWLAQHESDIDKKVASIKNQSIKSKLK